ncbi:MAG: fumarylacetoacetate hydrolase family protein [Proteobacteria bacterium]|nr:fumarylacetoacetate hydrolase family protein [Pseudomonadota bacterium]
MSARVFDPHAVAQFIADAHRLGTRYDNVPDAIAPKSVGEAYAAQEALRALWEPMWGPVAGLKIATTTKVMQALMGIDHPCGGMIYQKRIHAAPHILKLSDYQHCVIECELAVRVGRTLEKKASPWSPEQVRAEVVEAMPAFELIEDRRADYKATKAYSLIADNAWNAGIVLGPAVKVPKDLELNGLKARLETTASGVKEGATDDPMGALAWIANLAADRGRPLAAGQVVITGSVVATLPIAAGETFNFSLEKVGKAQITALK